MPNANDLRKGMAIKYNGEVVLVLDTQHRTPGNLRAFVQATLRSLRTGKSSNVRFTSTEPVEQVSLDRRKLEFSYKDNSGYNFIDPKTYDTVTLNEDFIGSMKDYLTENLACDILFVEGKAAAIEMPSSVNLKVINSPEGLRGDSATNVQKVAELETGLKVSVPLFIKEGELIKVSTTDGSYMGRA
jgi:elongation factor P